MFDEDSTEACYSRRKFLSVVPIFESKSEQHGFERYIELNMAKILKKLNTDIEEDDFLDIDDDNQRLKMNTQHSLDIGRTLVEELKKFRLEKE